MRLFFHRSGKTDTLINFPANTVECTKWNLW